MHIHDPRAAIALLRAVKSLVITNTTEIMGCTGVWTHLSEPDRACSPEAVGFFFWHFGRE